MASNLFKGDRGEFVYIPLLCIIVSLVVGMSSASVVLIGQNVSLSFDDIEANFVPSIKGSGVCGTLYVAEPLDACTPLTDKNISVEGANSRFALIIRGGCTFEDKVRTAQKAGFQAAIIYDNEDSGILVAMAGNSAGVKIHAIFVSKASGEVLKTFAGTSGLELWIIPNFENSAWSIMAISFISLLALSAVLATCFFVRRHRIRRERPQTPHVREFHGMSSRLVKALPSLIFTSVLEDNCTAGTCAICLEDYAPGDKLRVLPCCHKFHAMCVDSWLTIWRTFCPVCKRDARTGTGEPPASECTPLLSPTSSSMASSVPSSSAASPAIQIGRSGSFRSPNSSRASSLSMTATSYMPHSHRSNSFSSSLSISRSSYNIRNFPSSSQRSRHSLGYPPLDPRLASPYIPSPSNASPLYAESSSERLPSLLYCSGSAASISPLASAHSLPGC
ncbi:hypothetical protein AMTRI_Chr11g154230 [Amborella trichopoda]|uniref:RING-type domain-containing protein n=1 Tax=Amborella trichopoda TaxID=13333 RepID=W1NSJ5_AMBTC|nr:receptor homology region, transmembrane domain- and RING domain-containing protein 2 [Amborella trichopoda]ERM97839.1 hypothetical protein AMTR_s00118p00107060 [Amborella trichopoda]|eukprot:XP_006830423.1 receptor homology region, transmembrane domain- and RING domain-containing protein 2 [Amborella trichopoda]